MLLREKTMNLVKWLYIAGFAAILAACGGGGGSAGSAVSTGSTPTSSTTTTVVSTAADIVVGLDKTTLNNTGSDQVVLSVIAVNAGGNRLAGVPVSVSVNNNGIIGSLTPLLNGGFGTDETGTFRGAISSPEVKTNRIITATVTSGSAVKTVQISVIGSQIAITPVPAVPFVGDAVNFDVALKDSAGNPIANTPLVIGGTFGIVGSPITDSGGNVRLSGVAPLAAGAYSITASGSGINVSRTVTVVATGGVTNIPNATTITQGVLRANVTTIAVNSGSNANNRAQMSFTMIDTNNQPVENIRVRFSIDAPGLGAGEAMSTGSGIVYTDRTGKAFSDYIAGLRSSPTDGVIIRACYARTDAELAGGACPQFSLEELTVAGTALNLSIATGNTIEPVGVGNLYYRKTYGVTVADAAGQRVTGAVVSAVVDVTHYGKGLYSGFYTSGNVPPLRGDTPANGGLNTVSSPGGQTFTYVNPGTYLVTDSVTLATSTVEIRVWCANEDTNRNGFLDGGESVDGDLVLEPRVSDVIVLPVGSNVTNESGNVTFQVQWGQNVATWLAFTLRVTTIVGGSEGSNSTSFITTAVESDVPNGSFRTPPYGRNGCTTNN
jgi:hypothetical protein